MNYTQASRADLLAELSELKKKYDGVVYKRRILLPQKQAIDWITGMDSYTPKCQIGREMEYFRRYYHTLRPSVFLSYEREAFYCPEGGDFRVTFVPLRPRKNFTL